MHFNYLCAYISVTLNRIYILRDFLGHLKIIYSEITAYHKFKYGPFTFVHVLLQIYLIKLLILINIFKLFRYQL